MTIARLPDATLYYKRCGGSGDPTTLIHGSLTDHRGWDDAVPGLCRGLDVLAYDRRGHGRSDGGDRSRSVGTDVDDLGELLTRTDFRPAHLVAHGYGGLVALREAMVHPEHVRSIAVHEPIWAGLLVDDRAPEGPFGRIREEARTLGATPDAHRGEEVAVRVLRLLGGPADEWDRIPGAGREAIVQNLGAAVDEFGDDPSHRLAADALESVDVPILITVGERSAGFVRRLGESLVRQLPNASLLPLPGVGHFPQMTDPDLFVGVLGTFLLERNVPST